MNIDELISKLNQIKSEHGNVPICLYSHDGVAFLGDAKIEFLKKKVGREYRLRIFNKVVNPERMIGEKVVFLHKKIPTTT